MRFVKHMGQFSRNYSSEISLTIWVLANLYVWALIRKRALGLLWNKFYVKILIWNLAKAYVLILTTYRYFSSKTQEPLKLKVCYSRVLSFVIVLTLAMPFFPSPQAVPIEAYAAGGPNLIVQYDFAGNLNDSIGGSTCTVYNTTTGAFGTNADAANDQTYWSWKQSNNPGGGLIIDLNQNISESYSIGARFSYDNIDSGYNKIIDYKNLANDTGFYFYSNGKLQFYPHSSLGQTTTSANDIVDIVATREGSSNVFTAYIIKNGTLVKEVEVSDSSEQAIPSLVDGNPRFGFFFDDTATSGEHTGGGKVYSIKIWDGPITQLQAEQAMNASVTYNGNGSTGGAVPTNSAVYSQDATVTVLGNTGNLAKTGYTFASWNTQSDGQGTTYDATGTDTLTMPASNVILYAIWGPLAKSAQTITFDSIPEKTLADVPFALNAVASSGLTVTYTSSDPSVATISGSSITIAGQGTTNITASQAGDETYSAATPVVRTFRVVATEQSEDENKTSDSVNRNKSTTTSYLQLNGIRMANATSISVTRDRTGQKTTTIKLNNSSLYTVLNNLTNDSQPQQEPVVTIPYKGETDNLVLELNGQDVKDMGVQNVRLTLHSNQDSYSIPIKDIDMEEISNQMGQEVMLSDIKLRISRFEASAETVKTYENAAIQGAFEIIIPPVEYKIDCEYKGTLIQLDQFRSFLERTTALPDGVDPDQVTTAITVEEDGTVSHLPTEIFLMDGIHFVRVHSLTAAIYSVIWHPFSYGDLAGHWAEESANNMGSRLVIEGDANGNFNPKATMTRGEFVTTLTKALGLFHAREGVERFADVEVESPYYEVVGISIDYGLLSGYGDGTFQPDRIMNRQEMMVVLAKAAALLKLETINEKTMKDLLDYTKVSLWAEAYVEQNIQYGLIQGYNGELRPSDAVTKAEVAVALETLLKLAELIN